MLTTVYAMIALLAVNSEPMSSRPTQASVTTLKKEFDQFWREAQGKTFHDQLKIWDRVVESKHQALFDGLVWDDASTPAEKAALRETKLKARFATYTKLSVSISDQLEQFPSMLTKQVDRFRSVLPDFELRLPVVAMLAGPNGSVGSPKGTEDAVLEFSIDVMLDRGDDPDVLFAHELFHLYHGEKAKLWDAATDDDQTLVNLWTEGLASFASGVVVPGKKDGVLLLDPKLGDISVAKLPEIARAFLDMTRSKPKDAALWFRATKTWRNDMPPRTGYLLGFHVARQLAKKAPLAQMAAWALDDVRVRVKNELLTLASATP